MDKSDQAMRLMYQSGQITWLDYETYWFQTVTAGFGVQTVSTLCWCIALYVVINMLRGKL